MAQTTAAFCQSGYKVEISADGVVWSDVSGVGVGVGVSGGEAHVGEQVTAEGQYAIVVPSNKIAPFDITIRSVYTEDAAEAFAVAYALFIGTDKQIYARWTPQPGGAAPNRFNTSTTGGIESAVPIVACTPPALSASEYAPAVFELKLKTPALFMDTPT